MLSNGAHQFKSVNIHSSIRGNKVLKPSSSRSMLLASTAKSWGWTGFDFFLLFLLMAVINKLKSSQSSCCFSSRLGPAAPVGSKIIFIDEVMQSDWVLIVLILFRDRKRSLFCWWALCAHPEHWIYYNSCCLLLISDFDQFNLTVLETKLKQILKSQNVLHEAEISFNLSGRETEVPLCSGRGHREAGWTGEEDWEGRRRV